MRNFLLVFSVLLFQTVGTVSFVAAEVLPQSSTAATDPAALARSAVLMEFSTGRILFQKNPDHIIPPASLTKLMTLHLAYKAIEEGLVRPDQFVPITREVSALSLPRGSSLMFLEEGQKVTVAELMRGLAVASGNDAGLALAKLIAGSEANFVDLMNQEAQNLGFVYTHFEDSYGLSANNRTTAMEFARFARLYLTRHPQSLPELHSLRTFTYPLAQNLPGMRSRYGPILQHNRNTLLGEYAGLDGLKTGYIEEAGYNFVATAQRGPMRLIAVVLGVAGLNTNDGSEKRSRSARQLLDLGFDRYRFLRLPTPVLPPVVAWYTEPSLVEPRIASSPVYPLSEEEKARLMVKTELPAQVLGPWKPERPLGRLVYALDGQEILSVPLLSRDNVSEAPFFVKLWHAIVLFFQGLFGGAKPVDLTGPFSPPPGRSLSDPGLQSSKSTATERS